MPELEREVNISIHGHGGAKPFEGRRGFSSPIPGDPRLDPREIEMTWILQARPGITQEKASAT
jgi:hypothetical protein